jgi:uncharacterized membrane protein
MKSISVKNLVRCAMIAALYFVISVLVLPFAFGAVQVRVSEVLTLLPVLTPLGVWGVTIGCVLTNAYGVAVGANILGAADIFIGSAATLAAALISRALRDSRIGKVPVAAALAPVFVNAVVIGAELAFVETGHISGLAFWINMGHVGFGELLACVVLGLPMVYYLERSGLAKRLFGGD